MEKLDKYSEERYGEDFTPEQILYCNICYQDEAVYIVEDKELYVCEDKFCQLEAFLEIADIITNYNKPIVIPPNHNLIDPLKQYL